MADSADLAHLDAEQWDQLQDVADRFEEAWRKAGPVELGPFLPPPGDRLRRVTLHELIKVDLELRWRRGRPARLDLSLGRGARVGKAACIS